MGAVEDLGSTVRQWMERRLPAKEGPFGIPSGDCSNYEDPSGNAFALFQDIRPGAMEQAYAQGKNKQAARDVEPHAGKCRSALGPTASRGLVIVGRGVR